MDSGHGVRVLVIPSWYMTEREPYAGVFFRDQAEALQELCDVRVAIFTSFTFKDFFTYRAHGGARIHYSDENGVVHYNVNEWNMIPFAGTIMGLKGWIPAVKRLKRYIAHNEWIPDVIHAHSVYPAGKYAYALSRMIGIPYFITEHRTNVAQLFQHGHLGKMIRIYYRAARKVMAVSSGMKKTLTGHGLVRDIEVIPNFIREESFALKRPVPPSGTLRLLFVGSLMYKKGLDILMAALPLVKKTVPFKMVIIGDGPEETDIKQRALANDIERECTFAGSRSKREIEEYLFVSDILVLPSRVETFGIVVLEALATGTPVVATRCGGPEDILTGEDGVIVEPGNEKALAEGILKVYHDRSRYVPEQLRTRMLSRFSSGIVAKKLAEMYARAANVQ